MPFQATKRSALSRPRLTLHSIVSGNEAKMDPYPYVYLNADGSARELHPNERKYLETPFHPADGARPYIKGGYPQKDGWGEVKGYLSRSKLPQDIPINPAPVEDLSKPLAKEDHITFLRAKGMEVIENSDGSITATKPNR